MALNFILTIPISIVFLDNGLLFFKPSFMEVCSCKDSQAVYQVQITVPAIFSSKLTKMFYETKRTVFYFKYVLMGISGNEEIGQIRRLTPIFLRVPKVGLRIAGACSFLCIKDWLPESLNCFILFFVLCRIIKKQFVQL